MVNRVNAVCFGEVVIDPSDIIRLVIVIRGVEDVSARVNAVARHGVV